MGPRLLEVRSISKTFPGSKSLVDVSLAVDSGEVVALVGHHGSGKSTLIKILAGVYTADPGGEIHQDGQIRTDSSRLHFIHQDLGLVPMLSTLENLDLGRPRSAAAILPVRARRERLRAVELIGRFGAHFDVQAPVSALTPAERTIVAIA
jgi:ribose transport system ATP-binding protein